MQEGSIPEWANFHVSQFEIKFVHGEFNFEANNLLRWKALPMEDVILDLGEAMKDLGSESMDEF